MSERRTALIGPIRPGTAAEDARLGTGNLSGAYSTTGSTLVRYPWVDTNGDQFVQPNEIVYTATPLSYTSGYDYNNPTSVVTTGKIDPNLKDDYTNEFLIGFDKQIGNDIAVTASYIYRKYDRFRWDDTENWDSSNFKPVVWTPTGCPTGARCETITYYERTSQPSVNFLRTNRPDYYRTYKGIELNVRKRMSDNWMLNGGFSYNDAPVFYTSPRSYEDPTGIDMLHTGQYAPESTSSGLGNVFVNAKWIFRLSGAYTLPWYDINVAGFWNKRNGYPFLPTIQTPNRPVSGGRANVDLDRVGDTRLPDFQTVDFRLDKVFRFFGRYRVTASMDVFNLLNGNTSLSIRGGQNASNANQISSILAPRVIRFGFRATF
jgi:hypothetical protein